MNVKEIPINLAFNMRNSNLEENFKYPGGFNGHKSCQSDHSTAEIYFIYLEADAYSKIKKSPEEDPLLIFMDNHLTDTFSDKLLADLKEYTQYFQTYIRKDKSVTSKIVVNKFDSLQMEKNKRFEDGSSFLSNMLYNFDLNRDLTLNCDQAVNFEELDRIIVDMWDKNDLNDPPSAKDFKTKKEAIDYYYNILNKIKDKNPIVETRYTKSTNSYNASSIWFNTKTNTTYKVLLILSEGKYHVETFKMKD